MKIFLASSGELETERDQIELLISRKNTSLQNNGSGISLETIRWENLPQNFAPNRIQNEFNSKLLECEVLIVIFFKKVGVFTKEEFQIAFNSFKDDNNPRYIYVFFFEPPISLEELNDEYISILEMKKFIKEQEQIYISVSSKSELLLRITYELDFLLSQRSIINGGSPLLEEIDNIKSELDDIKEECCDKNQDRKITVKSKQSKKSKELDEILLTQLKAQFKAIQDKIDKDEILFGRANPSDIAERARLEFEINKFKNHIND